MCADATNPQVEVVPAEMTPLEALAWVRGVRLTAGMPAQLAMNLSPAVCELLVGLTEELPPEHLQ